MNCRTVQNQILVLPDPRVLPESLREHLGSCTGCLDWARQAARLESLLEQLPVPPAPQGLKAELLNSLTRDDRVIQSSFALPARRHALDSLWRYRETHRTLLAALAAGLLVVVGGWWLLSRTFPRPEVASITTPRYPFLKKVSDRYVALARAETQVKKLEDLGGLADDISSEARSLARVASAEELATLAGLFDKVKDGMVKQVNKMPLDTLTFRERAERKIQIDQAAEKLKDMAEKVESLTGSVPPDAKDPLNRMIRSARDGEGRLRKWGKAGTEKGSS